MVVTVSVKEAAEALGLCEQTVRTYIKDGKLRAFQIGRPYRIPISALADLGLVDGGEMSRILKEAQK